jgi:hypothetical protein
MQTSPRTEPTALFSALLEAYRKDSILVLEFLNVLDATQIVQQSVANRTALRNETPAPLLLGWGDLCNALRGHF